MSTVEREIATRGSKRSGRKPAAKKEAPAPKVTRIPAKSPKALPAKLTDRPEPDLRAFLLSHLTVSDRSWAPALGKPEREKGESRPAYIERVLAAE